MMESNLDQVREILGRIMRTDLSSARPDERLRDLGFDSLDRVTLLVSLEAMTGKPIPDGVFVRVLTVADVARLLSADQPESSTTRKLSAAARHAAAPVVPTAPVAPTEHIDPTAYVDPTAEVAAAAWIGARTKVWHQVQVSAGVRVGDDCVLGKGVYLATGTTVGNRVKIQNGCGVFGAKLEDEVMLAPGVYLLEDPTPRSTTSAGVLKGTDDWVRQPVTIRRGATVGAGATVAPGTTIGLYALVAIGSVVSHDVADHALVAGNPARQVGWVSQCGATLDDSLHCKRCGCTYSITPNGLMNAADA